LLQIRGNLIKS